MKKGQNTKEAILEKAATIFNKNGYAGSSLSELMKATGLQKGGIYNHFKNKEDILLQAFDFAIKKYNRAVYAAYKDTTDSISRLKAIIEFHGPYPLHPIIEGGCPIINTAVDSDNTNPVLKKKVKEALSGWIENLKFIINKGKDAGEINGDVDSGKAAIFIITNIQGAIVISRSFEDNSYMETTINQLMDFVNSVLKK